MAYKVFQNGYPLSASELNNYLMNQTVMAFASATERDNVLTAPTDGMVVYLQDTNILKSFNGSSWVDINDNTDAIQKSLLTTAGDLIVASGASTPARLGIGTNGQVLTSNGTTATWTSPAGGGDLAWTELFNGTISTGSSAATISSLSGYDKYAIRINGIQATGNFADFTFEINGVTTGSKRSFIQGANNQAGFQNANAGDDAVIPLANYGNYNSNAIYGFITLLGAKDTGKSLAMWQAGPVSLAADGYSKWGQAMQGKNGAALSSITFRTTSGTFNGGSLTIWGA